MRYASYLTKCKDYVKYLLLETWQQLAKSHCANPDSDRRSVHKIVPRVQFKKYNKHNTQNYAFNTFSFIVIVFIVDAPYLEENETLIKHYIKAVL